jgi:hypothetical protein
MAQIEVASMAVAGGGRAQSYRVVIDGQARGCVQSGETRRFAVVPGIHTVRLETARNAPVSVKIVVSGTTTLQCHTKARRLFGLLSAGDSETRIVVRERDDAPEFIWRGPEEALGQGAMLAAGD